MPAKNGKMNERKAVNINWNIRTAEFMANFFKRS